MRQMGEPKYFVSWGVTVCLILEVLCVCKVTSEFVISIHIYRISHEHSLFSYIKISICHSNQAVELDFGGIRGDGCGLQKCRNLNFIYSTISKSILLNNLLASNTLIFTLSPILYVLFVFSPIACLFSSL